MNAQATLEFIRTEPERWQQAQQRIGEVLSRSATDPEFRQQLLSEPRAALSRHLGREIPDSVNIRFIDAQGTPTVVLPDPVDPKAELSEAELEAVAGGVLPIVWFAVGFCAAALGDAIF